MLLTFPSRQLEIVGQIYLLAITPQPNAVANTWRFQLQNKKQGGFIPGGFKLRLIRESGEPSIQGEAVATSAVKILSVDVIVEPDTSLVWEIEPIPENYNRETLIF